MIRALVISLCAAGLLGACTTRSQVTVAADERGISRAMNAGFGSVVLGNGETLRVTTFMDVGPAVCFISACVRKDDLVEFTFYENQLDPVTTVLGIASAPVAVPGAVVLTGLMAAGAAENRSGGASSRVDREPENEQLRALARWPESGRLVFGVDGLTLGNSPCSTADRSDAFAPHTDFQAARWILDNLDTLRADCIRTATSLWRPILDRDEIDALNIFIRVRANWEAAHCDRLIIGATRPDEPAAIIYGGNSVQSVRSASDHRRAFALYIEFVRKPETIAYDAPFAAICAESGTGVADAALFEMRRALFQDVADLYYAGPVMVVDGDRSVTGAVSSLNAREANSEVQSLIEALPSDHVPGGERATETTGSLI